jgi:hypothetical protein
MNMKNTNVKIDMTLSELISKQISNLSDWRGQLLAQLRNLILEAAPDITEEWRWGTAVWSHKGLVRVVVTENVPDGNKH